MHTHNFRPSEKQGYEYCPDCGSYHSTQLADPVTIYENDYWSHDNNRSTFLEQRANLTERETCGISKVEKVLQYIPEKGTVLEIGASPAVLLQLLTLTGREAYGIEPDINVINKMKEYCAGATIIEGYFPDVFSKQSKEVFDCIVGMDVFEHINDTDGFVEAMHRLLKPNGVGIIMSPIIFEDSQYRDCDFSVPEQHAWIYSKKYLDPYLKQYFSSVEWDRWIVGHEMIILTK